MKRQKTITMFSNCRILEWDCRGKEGGERTTKYAVAVIGWALTRKGSHHDAYCNGRGRVEFSHASGRAVMTPTSGRVNEQKPGGGGGMTGERACPEVERRAINAGLYSWMRKNRRNAWTRGNLLKLARYVKSLGRTIPSGGPSDRGGEWEGGF